MTKTAEKDIQIVRLNRLRRWNMRLLCKIFGHKWEDVTATKAGFYDDIAHECLRCGSMQYSSRAKRELMKHITKCQSEESTRTTDEQIDEIALELYRHFLSDPLGYEGKMEHHTGKAKGAIQSLIRTEKQEAYRQGYNDNARNCYCDSPGATEGVLPHKHLMDDGESHDIRPEVKSIITTKRGD